MPRHFPTLFSVCLLAAAMPLTATGCASVDTASVDGASNNCASAAPFATEHALLPTYHIPAHDDDDAAPAGHAPDDRHGAHIMLIACGPIPAPSMLESSMFEVSMSEPVIRLGAGDALGRAVFVRYVAIAMSRASR